MHIDNENKERVMYYLSKTLHDANIRYTLIEKIYYAIIYSTQKLRLYMITNTTFIVAQVDLLRYLLSKPHLQGRPAKWIMELQEFDLIYMNIKEIKGQVIVDMFLEAPCEISTSSKDQLQDELVASVEEVDEKKCTLYFDGSNF